MKTKTWQESERLVERIKVREVREQQILVLRDRGWRVELGSLEAHYGILVLVYSIFIHKSNINTYLLRVPLCDS